MILDIPPHLETAIIQTAQAQGISATEWALTTLQHHATPSDDGIEFDMARMAQAIGEYDKNGRAVNTLSLPQGLSKAQLRTWLDENIPKHLEKKAIEQRAFV